MAPSTKRGLTALSFDDGPHVKYTARLLDIAKAYQAKFTFFVVGEKAVKQKSLLIRMRDEGHEIGNHSWTHPNFEHLPDALVQEEIRRCHCLIRDVTGAAPKLFRPPYGSISSTQREWVENHFRCHTTLWNIDSLDWRYRDCESVLKRILYQDLRDSVVLLHDIYASSIAASQKILEEMMVRGLECATISHLRSSLGMI